MPRITPFVRQVGLLERLRDFRGIAFVHELAHLAHLGVVDLDGFRNPRISPAWVEIVADYVTGRWARENVLESVFAKFMENQSGPSPTASPLIACSMEMFRVYLWFLRRGGALATNRDFQDWFPARYPQAPGLPRPARPQRGGMVPPSPSR